MDPRLTKMKLVQAMVAPSTCRRLDALARARGCSRAAYLRRLIELHVRAVTPEILRALDQTTTYGKKS